MIDHLGHALTRFLHATAFRRYDPPARLRPELAPVRGGLRVRWLGTAGHVVETDTTCVLLDPFLTRPGAPEVFRPLVPDDATIARHVPAKVDAVLCGHSHYDHLLDAPRIAKLRGAKLVGSLSTCLFGRATGLEEASLVIVPDSGATLRVGDLTIRFLPSVHAKVALGRVPFPGSVESPPVLPARIWKYRMGGAFGIWISNGATSVYHNGSADLVDVALDGVRADLALVGMAGRHATRDYVKRLMERLRPSWVLPTHHDSFFGPLADGLRLLPRVDLDGFERELRDVLPAARFASPRYEEAFVIGEGRDGGFVT